jgi:hypothetical protein
VTDLSRDPIEEIRELLTDYGIVGEEDSKVLTFLLCLSGRIPRTKLKSMVLVKGEPGSGKSGLVSIADLFRVKDVGRFTAHALDYTDLEGYEILRLKELGRMDDEEQSGLSTLKFLSSDDKGYTVEYVIREKDGHFKTETKTIPPITVLTTTTRIAIDEQLGRRAWIITSDDSEELTKQVFASKGESHIEGILKELDCVKETRKERATKRLQEIIGEADRDSILPVIPFPNALALLMDPKHCRSRGDFDKVLNLCELLCYVYAQRLPNVHVTSVKPNRLLVFATRELASKAITLASASMKSMTAGIDERAFRILAQLVELNAQGSLTVVEREVRVDKAVRAKIARATGYHDKTIRRLLYQMSEFNLITREEGPKTAEAIYFADLDKTDLSKLVQTKLVTTIDDETRATLNEILGHLDTGGAVNIESLVQAVQGSDETVGQAAGVQASPASGIPPGGTPVQDSKPKTLDELRALNPAMDEPTLLLAARQMGIIEEKEVS